MDNISSLFHTSLDRIKASGQNQYTAICPFHDDHNRSFSFNDYSGLSHCFACGWKGNAYQYAKEREFDNPHQYIIDDGYTSSNTLIDKNVQSVQYIPKKENQEMEQNAQNAQKTDKKETNYIELANIMEQYKQNLKDKWDDLEYKNVWDKSIIDDLDIGIDNNGALQFAHHDINGKIICVRTHKSFPMGDKQSKWFLRHKIAEYSKEKEIYICEGEKDATTLYSKGFQSTSSTTGCASIPKNEDGQNDFKWLKDWKDDVYIPYDNDDGGRKGAETLSQQIIQEYPNLNVKITKWNDSLKNKYDVYDAFKDESSTSGKMFWDSVANAEIVKFKLPSTIDGIELIDVEDADCNPVEDVVEIIESMLPEKCQIVLGGTAKSNKSYFAMQMGMSLAIDAEHFLSFKINKKGQKVLYVDTEVGKPEMKRRYQRIQQHFKWTKSASHRFRMLSVKEMKGNIYKTIEKYIKLIKPDIVIIDCLYNTAEGRDITKNHHLKPVLDIITAMKLRNDLTMVLVHHMTKGNHERGLSWERMSGGGILGYWMEHAILLTKTNEWNVRLLKFDGARAIGYPECYYGIEWDDKKFKLGNIEMIEDWKPLMLSEQKTHTFSKALDEMPDEFSTNDFRNYAENMLGVTDRTSRNWLTEMVKIKVIERISQGQYKKRLSIYRHQEV